MSKELNRTDEHSDSVSLLLLTVLVVSSFLRIGLKPGVFGQGAHLDALGLLLFPGEAVVSFPPVLEDVLTGLGMGLGLYIAAWRAASEAMENMVLYVLVFGVR